MTRREWTHLAILIVAAAIIRVALIPEVGIWRDISFYLYDARMILAGQRPFVDFLGRSPAFIYLYAGVRAVVGQPVLSLRGLIVALWLLTGVPVYDIARQLADHRSGLAAVAVFLFSPFMLSYGMWSNTQSLAALAGATGAAVLVRRQDLPAVALAGGLFSLAYLSRRSVVVLLFATLLYFGLLGVRTRRWRPLVARTGTLGVVFGAMLLVGYWLTVGGGVDRTLALAEIHTVNLFISSGRGGFPILGVEAPLTQNSIDRGRIPIVNDLCKTCSPWTAQVLAKTLLVGLPGVSVGWVYVRELDARALDERLTPYLYAALAAAGVWAAYLSVQSGHWIRVGALLSLALTALVVYRADPVPTALLTDSRSLYVLLIAGGLIAGYLYRDPLLHTYYFADVAPHGAVLAGVLGVAVWRRSAVPWRRVGAVAIALGMTVSLLAGNPLLLFTTADGAAADWFTTDNIAEMSADIDARTEAGDVVYSAAPAYLAGTNATTIQNTSRTQIYITRYEDDPPADRIYRPLNRGLESGAVEYVIMDNTTLLTFETNATARSRFLGNYCRVPNQSPAYAEVNAILYRYEPDCPAVRQPQTDWPALTEGNAAT